MVHPDPSNTVLIPSAVVSAAISGALFWRWFIAPEQTPSRRRVILSMVGAIVFGHILTWALFGVSTDLQNYILHPGELFKIPFLAILFGIASLLLIGWLTIPLGVLIGLAFRRHRNRDTAPGQAQSS